MRELKACQIGCVGQIGRPNGFADVMWQQRNRLRRILKRRWRYVVNLLAERAGKPTPAGATALVRNSQAQPSARAT
jgi:hypothetical protein